MDVAKEFAAVNYRIKLRARRMALEAEARIYDMEPDRYIELVLYSQELSAAERSRAAAAQAMDGMERVGYAYGQLAKTVREMAAALSRGFQAGSA